MRLFSRTVWAFVAPLAYLGATVDATGVLELDLVYPRYMQSYAPAPFTPVVFGIQNAHLAQHLNLYIDFHVQSNNDPNPNRNTHRLDLGSLNWTSTEPFYTYAFIKDFAAEGNWTFWFSLGYTSCKTEVGGRFQGRTAPGRETTSILMSTKNDGRAMDLVAATADEESCHGVIPGLAINVGEEVMQVTKPVKGDRDTCVMVPDEAWALKYCDLKVDSALAANITASLVTVCAAANPPVDCSAATKPSTTNSSATHSSATHSSATHSSATSSTGNPSTTAQSTTGPSRPSPSTNAAQELGTVGTACFAAALGALGFLLA